MLCLQCLASISKTCEHTKGLSGTLAEAAAACVQRCYCAPARMMDYTSCCENVFSEIAKFVVVLDTKPAKLEHNTWGLLQTLC